MQKRRGKAAKLSCAAFDGYYSIGKSYCRSLTPILFGGATRARAFHILLLSLFLAQPCAVVAQDAMPSDALKSCDLAAASPFDKQRPTDVPGVEPKVIDASTAIPACEAAVRAAPQDPRMLYQLARAYRRDKRFAEALPLYQKADEMGNALAAEALSEMYKKGQGVEVDLKQQLYYVDRATRAGLSVAEYNYGILYGNGNAVLPKDENLARQLIDLAARDNYPPAMNMMGVMLAHGMGGNKDEVEARYWYERAARAGNYNAMNNFGVYLQMGRGGPEDLAEARGWFEKSANGNDPDGTNSLGLMFEKGFAGPKDLDEARRQYRKAIALGEKRFAAKNLARLDAANQ